MTKRRIELTLPELGLADLPVLASVWLVELGHRVNEGDRLLEVLAEDVTVDLPSPATGVLVETLVSEDDELCVGQALAIIECEE